MPAKSKVTEAPYTENGDLMHFPEDRYDYSQAVRLEAGYGWKVPPRTVTPDWRPNVPFAKTLRLMETRRGRSAAYFIWHDEDGREFPMFITDMLALVQSGMAIAGGTVTTRWMVTKRGAKSSLASRRPGGSRIRMRSSIKLFGRALRSGKLGPGTWRSCRSTCPRYWRICDQVPSLCYPRPDGRPCREPPRFLLWRGARY